MSLKATYVLNIFVAYVPSDKKWFDLCFAELEKLRPRQGYVINRVFSDGKDLKELGGDVFLASLLEHADLVLPLLSDDSIFTSYFSGPLMRKVVKDFELGRLQCLPLLLNTCWWEDTIFRNLEIYPKGALPIFDLHTPKAELLEQVRLEIEHRLDQIILAKQVLEEQFKHLFAQAEERFAQREENPDRLATAMPLYEEARQHWREGFMPPLETVLAKIAICQREIDFRHYALAAEQAYKKKDIETAFFNCKDALALRKDAAMDKLFAIVSKLREEQLRGHAKIAFEQAIQKGHQAFLTLQWDKARAFFEQALANYFPSFNPDDKTIKHKIEICEREYQFELAMKQAEEAETRQQYALAAKHITDMIETVNAKALAEAKRYVDILTKLEYIRPFRDAHNNRWGYYHELNKQVLIPAKYMAAYPFQENLAGVKKWELWGFINVEGQTIIPFQYQFARSFKDGKAEVYQGSERFFINHLGERLAD